MNEEYELRKHQQELSKTNLLPTQPLSKTIDAALEFVCFLGERNHFECFKEFRRTILKARELMLIEIETNKGKDWVNSTLDERQEFLKSIGHL